MHEAQDTILYHLSKATEFCVSEKDVVNFCRVDIFKNIIFYKSL